MSASNVNKAAGPRQVTCATSDADEIPVDLDVLHRSRFFKKMYDDLCLEEHDKFPGVFPVKNVSSRTFKKVTDWFTDHKDEPELIIEKDPLSQQCKWFTFTQAEHRFFDVPMPELLELIMAASYLDIPRLYHYACQAVAARIKGKRPCEICNMLQQNCDLDDAQIRKALDDNPWLDASGLFSGALDENAVFIPNEVLLTIFGKLPREDLERLQLVSTQFNDVVTNSSELIEHQGPLRVVSTVKVRGRSFYEVGGRFSKKIEVCLRDGTKIACPDHKTLAKRLKTATVLTVDVHADVQEFTALLPVKSAWKNATIDASMDGFPSTALLEFAFAQLFFCKEIVLGGEGQSFTWSRLHMRLPAIAACNKLNIRGLTLCALKAADVAEWLEHEVTPEKKWSEPREMILHERGITGGIDGLLTALKTAFLASTSRKPYVVRIHRFYHRRDNMNDVLTNEETHERLSIRTVHVYDVVVERS